MNGTHVALLRGINVGGKNKLPMKDLARMFVAAGCGGVRTYIQSGNVIFRADEPVAARIPQLISKAIEDEFGYRIEILLRTLEQLRRTVLGNPFLEAGCDPAWLHVAFLSAAANTEALQQMDANRFLPDAFALRGSDLYFCLPSGIGVSKLAAAAGAKLRNACTVRNWRTTTTLLALMDGDAG
jgi:uncharacterized protein (DUF1697 family)